jgi:NADH dehydrogenase/NADH:ubiquinone reductase (non-electrogenic)
MTSLIASLIIAPQLSWSNMMLVPMYWFKSLVFGRDISRF